MEKFWLPPELWKAIFNIATYYEGELDVYEWIRRSDRTKNLNPDDIDLELARLDIASHHSDNFQLINEPKFLDKIALRLSLVSVCMDWYDMSIEYLYTSVMIRGSGNLSGCVSALKRNDKLCSAVRRLEFTDDDEDPEEGHIRNLPQSVAQLIELCPNLLIFSGTVELDHQQALAAGSIDAPLRLRGPLANHCPNLQHAIGHSLLDGYPATRFFRYINSFSKLIALQLPPCIAALPATEKPTIILPCLRILDIGSQLPLIPREFASYLSRWDLPSLDTVHLGTITREVGLQRFWAKHGTGLRTIKIYNAQDNFMGRRLTESNLGIDVPSDILFPNLRQLIILHNNPGNLLSLFLPSKSLEIYEVPLVETWKTNIPAIKHLIQQLSGQHLAPLVTAARSPNLRHVRISGYPLDADAVGGRQLGIFDDLEDVFMRWGQLLGERGVSLERIHSSD